MLRLRTSRRMKGKDLRLDNSDRPYGAGVQWQRENR